VDPVTSKVVPNVRRRGLLYHFSPTSSTVEVEVAGFTETNGTLDTTDIISRALDKQPRPASWTSSKKDRSRLLTGRHFVYSKTNDVRNTYTCLRRGTQRFRP
jgi:hypothetical protein